VIGSAPCAIGATWNNNPQNKKALIQGTIMSFTRMVLALWLSMITLVSGVLLPSRLTSVPNDLESLGLGLCDGQLCFMGILPGVSEWKDVTPILNYLDDLDTYGLFASGKLKNIYVNITASTAGVVTSVEFAALTSKDNLGVPLRSIVQLLGSPCIVGFLREASHPRLIYPTIAVDLVLDRDRMTDASPADYLLILPKTDSTLRCQSNPAASLVHWKGFAALRSYWR
jgi:hypothetical protein